MLRVLTLSTLYPNAVQPTLGVFVERQTKELAALADVELEVVSPVGLPPWPLAHHPHYRARAAPPRKEEWNGLTVHRPRYPVLPMVGHHRTARSMARALLPLLRDMRRRFPFDAIDAEFFWPDGPAAAEVSLALDVPFLIKARGSDIHHWGHRPRIRDQIVDAGRSADALLSVSGALKSVMTGMGMPGEKIAVHYTGVDSDIFKPRDRMAAKAAIGIAGPLIAAAGALIPGKGQRLVLDALRELPGATLILIGDGPDRKALEDHVASAGVAGRVRFLGNRPHRDLPGLLAAADVMVLPSAAEGLANVWVEALACGTPVVISDVGGAREVLDRPEAGRIVDRTPAAIAAAVRDILSDPPDPQAVRAASARFSWSANAASLHATLAGIVEKKRAISRSA